MENLTHSLVGAAIAELTLPPAATTAQRRVFFVAGVVAANLPDGDLFYTRITPAPLGYLLQHRGYTHTLVGCLGLAIVCWLLACMIPRVRHVVVETPGRFWLLIGVALLSHIVLDSWNSYGVHPFWPFDNRWYYGDAVSIAEPWLWVLLGVAAAANTRNRYGQLLVAAIVIALPFVFVYVGFLSASLLVASAIVGAALAWTSVRVAPRTRSITALVAVALFVAAMFGLEPIARARVLARLPTDARGGIVDVILSPRAASPLCWTAIAISKNEAAGTYTLQRGEVPAGPNRLAPARCETWSEPEVQTLARLRDLARDDCWVNAWLRFGRAPYIDGGGIADYRFGNRGGNFSDMSIQSKSSASCPPNVPHWETPRADLLGGSH